MSRILMNLDLMGDARRVFQSNAEQLNYLISHLEHNLERINQMLDESDLDENSKLQLISIRTKIEKYLLDLAQLLQNKFDELASDLQYAAESLKSADSASNSLFM